MYKRQALKDANGGVAWSEWDDALKFRKPEAIEEAKEKYADDIAFYKMLQYLFFKQWTALKAVSYTHLDVYKRQPSGRA